MKTRRYPVLLARPVRRRDWSGDMITVWHARGAHFAECSINTRPSRVTGWRTVGLTAKGLARSAVTS